MSEVDSVIGMPQNDSVWHTTLPQGAGSRGGILILADSGVAFQGLKKAAQQCFPRLGVTLSSTISRLDEEELAPRLILIQALAFRGTAEMVAHCRARYPDSPIALMVDAGWSDVPGLRALIAERQVHGLLPSSLQINVWLAAVWLLLNGGEYFPSADHPQAPVRVAGAAHAGPSGPRVPSTIQGDRPGGATRTMLSTREGEVLELVSEGLQNKLIAVKMDLSEHTVKVHVHNIIRKLKVHNRTQAAAMYRSSTRPGGIGRTDIAVSPNWLEHTGA